MSATEATGPLTFLFTDIEGSTRLAHELGDDWFGVLQAHHSILRDVFPGFGGREVSTAGDSFFVVFGSALDAIGATVAMQRAIAAHDWMPHPPIHVRMGLHTGEAVMHAGDYAGLTVHAASRVESAAAGGQVLITAETARAAGSALDGMDGIDLLDLGMHRLKDLPAPLQLFQVVAAGLPREFPPVRGIDIERNNIPVPPSTFVGRTEALSKLHRLLDTDRLLTLFGPGGAGKTRLSLRLALERLHRYSDGVWLVELDPATDDASLVAAIAAVLAVREEPGKTLLAALVDHVKERQLLLLLDNCEHVIDAAASTAEALLRAGPGVRILATSREPLRIAGERVWPVPPLSSDGDGAEAIQLLVDRVQLLDPDFVLGPEQLPSAQTITRRLDGLPLAIELAAASTLTLSLDEIAEQLDHRFEVLTSGSRTALDRQKTLWGAIDWSYAMLESDLRMLFRQLGVFPSDFDAPAVLGIAGTAAGLEVLVTKALVTQTPAGRFRLLESIRAFAREELASTGEADAVAERHARWFAAAIKSDGVLDRAHDDAVLSLLWATNRDHPLAVEVLVDLQRFWLTRARWTEGRFLTEPVLAATAHVRTLQRAQALSNAAHLALYQRDLGAAVTLYEDAMELEQEVTGGESANRYLGDLGVIAYQQGDFETAEGLFATALQAVRSQGEVVNVARIHSHLAVMAHARGHLFEAIQHGNAALEVARKIGEQETVTAMVNLLGVMAHEGGDLATAAALYQEALVSARQTGAIQPVMYLLYCLGSLALDDGRPLDAVPLLHEAVTLGRDLDLHADLAESLEAVARLAGAVGRPSAGARLLAATTALREVIQYPRPVPEVDKYEAERAALSAILGSSAFRAAWEAGQATTLDEALLVALDILAIDGRIPD